MKKNKFHLGQLVLYINTDLMSIYKVFKIISIYYKGNKKFDTVVYDLKCIENKRDFGAIKENELYLLSEISKLKFLEISRLESYINKYQNEIKEIENKYNILEKEINKYNEE